MSELINKKENNTFKYTDIDNKKYNFKIDGIFENYAGNYVIMNKNTYEKVIGEYKTNIIYINLKNDKKEEKISKDIMKNDSVISIVSIKQTMKSVKNMLNTLNSVVLVLLILSGSLSFVVLYNLSYINICERKREIATLKVLGFDDKEVDNYINKEIIIMTVIGIIFGLLIGSFLSNIIVRTIEINQVRFVRQIKIESYIYTSLIIMIFTIIVSTIIHFYLKKIDMIESLKSVE